ncbi:MAG: hypothetical protein JWN01_548 [Patescibacteria group bacterium]|nr:hypothetical protein [Patescibacteria group bacterium]
MSSALPPWIWPHVATDPYFGAIERRSFCRVVALLHEIGQFKGKRDFVALDPPRSTVYYPTTGLYLYLRSAVKGLRPLASFELMDGNFIRSVCLTFRDPLNPQGGKRGSEQVMHSGWMGTVALIASAVNQSPFFGRLETIEVSNRRTKSLYSDVPGANLSIYEIWATPRQSWTVSWLKNRAYPADGSIEFRHNQPVLLASVTVERPIVNDPRLECEIVRDVALYPQVCAELEGWTDVDDCYGDDPSASPFAYQGIGFVVERDHPFLGIESDERVLNLPPHSEIVLDGRSFKRL